MLYDSPYLRKEEKVAPTKSKERTERNIQILQISGVAYLVKKHIELVLHFCQSYQTLDPSSLAPLTKEIVCWSFNGRRKQANSNHIVTFAAACFFRPAHERLHMKTITSHYLAEVLTYIPDQLKETATQISLSVLNFLKLFMLAGASLFLFFCTLWKHRLIISSRM